MRRFSLSLLCLAALMAAMPQPALASYGQKGVYTGATPTRDAPLVTYPAAEPPAVSANLVSFSLGWFDAQNDLPRKQAADLRAEYQWGLSLIPALFPTTKSFDRYAQIHPFVGVESSSRFQVYGYGGFGVDVMLFENLILTPSFAAGLYGKGDGKDMGGAIQFRPQIELGYRFPNQARTSVFYSRLTNAGLRSENPGASTIGFSLHVPTRVMFGRW